MNRVLLVCAFCQRTWDPGSERDCRMCRGRSAAWHGLHAMCFDCQDVYRKVVRHAELTPREAEQLSRAPILRQKLAIELGEMRV